MRGRSINPVNSPFNGLGEVKPMNAAAKLGSRRNVCFALTLPLRPNSKPAPPINGGNEVNGEPLPVTKLLDGIKEVGPGPGGVGELGPGKLPPPPKVGGGVLGGVLDPLPPLPPPGNDPDPGNVEVGPGIIGDCGSFIDGAVIKLPGVVVDENEDFLPPNKPLKLAPINRDGFVTPILVGTELTGNGVKPALVNPVFNGEILPPAAPIIP